MTLHQSLSLIISNTSHAHTHFSLQTCSTVPWQSLWSLSRKVRCVLPLNVIHIPGPACEMSHSFLPLLSFAWQRAKVLHHSNKDLYLISDITPGWCAVSVCGCSTDTVFVELEKRIFVDCLGENYRKRQLQVFRPNQDICETDGFLLQPFHIFISFLELYDTVFQTPGEGKDKRHRH